MKSQRIAVVTLDTLTARMAGPAIRAWEISRVLSESGHAVRLLTFSKCERQGTGFTAARVTVDGFRGEVKAADILIMQGYLLETFGWIRNANCAVVIDLYDPFHLESLEVDKFRSQPERHASLDRAVNELRAEVERGDFFLCASERQRDLWMGHLAAWGRLNPDTYDADPSLRSLIDVAPFGCGSEPPVQTRHGIRGVVPGIAEDDKVVIWGGGVYNWFDPLTVVEAVDIARAEVPDLRLFFLGMKHPNPDVPEMAMANRVRLESDRRGLTGVHVFFYHDWVEYEDRGNYLLDADVGISAHFDHVETSYSFRTRMLDYLWAGLPIVCSEGDSFGALVAERHIGVAIPVSDAAAMARALVMLLSDMQVARDTRDRVRDVATEFHWEKALLPLVEFCAAPHRAADFARLTAGQVTQPMPWRARFRRDAVGTVRALASGGLPEAAHKIRWRVARILQR